MIKVTKNNFNLMLHLIQQQTIKKIEHGSPCLLIN